MTARPTALVAVKAVALALSLAGCAALPETPRALPEPTSDGAPPVVEAEQALEVETQVAQRSAAAAVDPTLLPDSASGPALELAQARATIVGPAAEAAPVEVTPADLLVAPTVTGWPRWFLTVRTPAGGESSTEEAAAAADALPVLRVYDSTTARDPYRLWAELDLLPGATVPGFPAPEVGADVLPGDSGSGGTDPGTSEDAGSDGSDLSAAVADLAARYASVLSDGDAGEFAAQFEPDPYVEAVRARTAAETAAVAEVADLTVTHAAATDSGGPFIALSSEGDALVVTAVRSTTTATVRPGAGVLRPGAEVGALAGVDEADSSLTTTSLAVLAFVVPAESGAIRLIAVDEGLVDAEAG